jgi:hypothetical protein
MPLPGVRVIISDALGIARILLAFAGWKPTVIQKCDLRLVAGRKWREGDEIAYT